MTAAPSIVARVGRSVGGKSQAVAAEDPRLSIGAKVSLRLASLGGGEGGAAVASAQQQQVVRGTVVASDAVTATLLLQSPGAHNGVATIIFIRTAFISEILSSEPPPPGSPVDTTLPPVDLDRCRKREERALLQAEADASRVGEGVTKGAQAIFDALSKTMPCRWQGKTVVVLEEIFVEEPYTPGAARSSSMEHQATLLRVQKVLTAERQRLGL